MKQKIKYIKIYFSILALVFVSAGCGGGGGNPVQQGPITLVFWKTFEDSGHMSALLEGYRQLRPNVEVVYIKKNIENYEADLLDALASGEGPDIFSIHNTWLSEYADKISPAPDKVFNLKNYSEAFVDTAKEDFTKDGKIYGVPLAVDSLGLYYNKDLLGSAGIAVPARTWQELSLHTSKITKRDNKGYFTRSSIPLGLSMNINRAVDIYYLFMLQLGFDPLTFQNAFGGSFSEGKSLAGVSFPAKDALDFYSSFADPSSENYTWNARSDYSIDAFVNGRSAYLFSYSYTRQTIKQKSPNLRFDVAPVPQYSLDNPNVNFSNYWGEVVSKQSKNQAVAWDFLKYISSKEALDKYYASNKQPSSRRDLIELQTQDPEIGVFAFGNLTAHSLQRPKQAKFDGIIGNMIDDVILKSVNIDEAISRSEQQIGTLLRE